MINKYTSDTFIKAQLSSVIATAADFLLTHVLTGFMGLWYLLSSISGSVFGGIINFLLGRNWVFNAKKNNKTSQLKRYFLIWTGSLILNASGVYLFTEIFQLHYMVSKLLVSIAVSVFFNYYFQKLFVFKIKNEIV